MRTNLSEYTSETYVSVVIPVYKGENSLKALVESIIELFTVPQTCSEKQWRVAEILLVHDCGPDASDRVISELAVIYPQVKPIWLTKNFGQHAATLAGMSSATGDWVITMDEDGEHSPKSIPDMMESALTNSWQVLYAEPINVPPHGFYRNLASVVSKRLGRWFTGQREMEFINSFRVIRGDIARSLAAYCGSGVFLDVGLFWISGKVGKCPTSNGTVISRASGYTYRKLISHFWRLVLSSGTRPLRIVSVLGLASVLFALTLGLYVVYEKLTGHIPVDGWTSLVVIISFFFGSILMCIGMVAEYLSLLASQALGKPLYVISSKQDKYH